MIASDTKRVSVDINGDERVARERSLVSCDEERDWSANAGQLGWETCSVSFDCAPTAMRVRVQERAPCEKESLWLKLLCSKVRVGRSSACRDSGDRDGKWCRIACAKSQL